MLKDTVYMHDGSVAGAAKTISSSAMKFGGYTLNGSAGGCTLNVYDGVTLILTTSAAASALLTRVFEIPVVFRTSLLATCSGTGFYQVFYTT